MFTTVADINIFTGYARFTINSEKDINAALPADQFINLNDGVLLIIQA